MTVNSLVWYESGDEELFYQIFCFNVLDVQLSHSTPYFHEKHYTVLWHLWSRAIFNIIIRNSFEEIDFTKTKNRFLLVIFQHKSNKVPNFYFQASISLWHQKTKDAQCQLKLPKKWEIYGVFNLSTNQRGCVWVSLVS